MPAAWARPRAGNGQTIIVAVAMFTFSFLEFRRKRLSWLSSLCAGCQDMVVLMKGLYGRGTMHVVWGSKVRAVQAICGGLWQLRDHS